MSRSPVLYIAGMGMITPVGINSEMTSAAVNAGINSYRVSEFEDADGNAIKMSTVPEDVFLNYPKEINEGDYYSERFDHIIKMTNIALGEC